ncbi:DUF4240 domain-containing protein [Chishuiella sp.]|uniref:DUF4240 domain-containing protein n=1 Tax=Chishuiella sp. TaxID=1969467 RepID=UPI0028ADB7ED|nr:DUF4240 domain-containing protein [Chishuiella sp.]
MNFLDDIFNSFSPPTEKISKMLEEDFFWQIIEDSLDESNNLQEQKYSVAKQLNNLVAEDIIGFQLRLENYLCSLHTPEIWCAACIMNDDTDPKHFYYFKNWIVSQGRELYEKAVNNPDDLSFYFEEGFNDDDLYEFEGFNEITDEIFRVKINKPIQEYVNDSSLVIFTENSPKPEFEWDDENMMNLQIFCPRLYKIFIEDYFNHDDDDE